MVPSVLSAQVCHAPAATLSYRPGGGLDWPRWLSPQHTMVLSVRIPQVCSVPAETAVKDPVGGLCPPRLDLPQHWMLWSVRIPHAYEWLAVTATNEPVGTCVTTEFSPQQVTVCSDLIPHDSPLPADTVVKVPPGSVGLPEAVVAPALDGVVVLDRARVAVADGHSFERSARLVWHPDGEVPPAVNRPVADPADVVEAPAVKGPVGSDPARIAPPS